MNCRYAIISLMAGMAALTACQNGDEHTFENKVFISEDSFARQLRVQRDEGVTEMSYDLSVGMASPMDKDIQVTFRTAPELLATYQNAYYDATAQLLPEANYDFRDLSTVIRAESVTSEALTLDFINLDQLDYSTDYVLPLTISEATGVGILESARTIYLVVSEASLINVVADFNDNLAWVDWTNKAPMQNMTEFTLEALVNANSFNNEEISTVMGIEDNFLIRLGDNGHDKNQLNVAYGTPVDGQDINARGSVFVERPLFQTGQWYHIAVTFNAVDYEHGRIEVYVDGALVASADEAVTDKPDTYLTSVDFTTGESIDGTGRPDENDGRPRAFWVGFSYSTDDPTARDFDGMIAEARIWNRALTAEEINAPNHFYKVSPDSEGLVAYWKFCDATGDVIRDYTSYGNNLQADHAPTWVEVELPEK